MTDEDPGVDEVDLPRISERFFRGRKNGVAGTGLGLTIAAELVRAHGGHIRLVDSAIGATFRIEIPDRPVKLHAPRDRARA